MDSLTEMVNELQMRFEGKENWLKTDIFVDWKFWFYLFLITATDPTQDTEISSSVLTSESENQPQTAETDEEEDYQFDFTIKYRQKSYDKLIVLWREAPQNFIMCRISLSI